jgi:membrane associated rhomboid family serine protease
MGEEAQTLKQSLKLPIAFVLLLWGIHLIEVLSDEELAAFMGILPRQAEGLLGIVTFPLIHGGWGHLSSNSLPLIILGTAILFFYRPIALRSIAFIYLLHGALVFLAARPVTHIGASGLVYGFAAFLLTSGILRRERSLMALSMLVIFIYGVRRERSLMALSMLVIFIYGGMIWGVLPIREGVSWEGHLFGAIAGIAAAFYYRREGPQRTPYEWEQEDNLPETGVWDYRTHFPPPRHPDKEQ